MDTDLVRWVKGKACQCTFLVDFLFSPVSSLWTLNSRWPQKQQEGFFFPTRECPKLSRDRKGWDSKNKVLKCPSNQSKAFIRGINLQSAAASPLCGQSEKSDVLPALQQGCQAMECTLWGFKEFGFKKLRPVSCSCFGQQPTPHYQCLALFKTQAQAQSC
jgi:hypothetical protein